MSAEEFARLVDEAGFVFEGKVVSPKPAETATGGETGLGSITVEVEDVLRGTDITRSLVGSEVTVVQERGGPVIKGDVRVFFTDVVSIGDVVVVREVAQRDASDATRRDVAEGVRMAAERPLVERLAGADLVVAGHVTSARPVAEEAEPVSEHDPLWWIARIAVESVLKGRSSRRNVEVLFASSLDIAWYRSPKLDEGVSGIFILRKRDADEAPKEVAESVYQATDPLDFLPHDRLDDVQRMLGRDGGAD
jgi:hypothetical protein